MNALSIRLPPFRRGHISRPYTTSSLAEEASHTRFFWPVVIN